MSVTTRLETITPAKAQKWLDHAAPNRPKRRAVAQRMANAILDGEWEVNGETIKFDDTGKMIDGQHRCMAVVLSGQNVKSFVTRGLNTVTFDTIDTGCSRKTSDVFAKYNEKNYCTLAAAVSWLSRFQSGTLLQGRRTAPTHKQARAILDAHPALRQSCIWGDRVKHLLAPSAGTFLHYMFARKSQEDADFFFEHLASGENLSASSRKTSAILALQRILQNNRANLARMQTETLIGIAIQAWNTMRVGHVVKKLRVPKDGYTSQDFPEIK